MNEQFIRARYPHIRASEAAIWSRFLGTTELGFERVTYDLHLGEGVLVTEGEPEWLRRLKLATSRRRVDAVAETAEDIWIFEVKERVGLSALGQLLAYFDLYVEEYRPYKAVFLAAIGPRMEPDIRATFELHAVNIFLV